MSLGSFAQCVNYVGGVGGRVHAGVCIFSSGGSVVLGSRDRFCFVLTRSINSSVLQLNTTTPYPNPHQPHPPKKTKQTKAGDRLHVTDQLQALEPLKVMIAFDLARTISVL